MRQKFSKSSSCVWGRNLLSPAIVPPPGVMSLQGGNLAPPGATSGATKSIRADGVLAHLCEVDSGATKRVGVDQISAQVDF